MPSYDYKCKDCQKTFTDVRKMSEKTEKCPHCTSEDIQQVISNGNFTLGGKGNWFKRDGEY